MITPINFTGIKNVGYARALTGSNNNPGTRTVLNMQLTDDDKKDLSKYKKLTSKHPDLENKINSNYLNIELETKNIDGFCLCRAKMNGNIIPSIAENIPILNFMSEITARIANFKEKDFKTDPDHHLMNEAKHGIFYNEPLDYFLDGTAGELDLLAGTGLTEKFDLYANDENIELSEEDEEKLFDFEDGILEVLHNPCYVHNGAQLTNSIMKYYYDSQLYS